MHSSSNLHPCSLCSHYMFMKVTDNAGLVAVSQLVNLEYSLNFDLLLKKTGQVRPQTTASSPFIVM